MKKRSLFAAVAMLIVSALVLTSATYAWFQSGGNAYITAYDSTTVNAGTGVQLKTTVNNADWQNTLVYSDFTGSTDHLVKNFTGAAGQTGDGKLHPVSSYNGSSFKAYDINTSNQFHKLTPVDGWYDVYTFSVGTVAAGDNVTCKLNLSGDAAAAARVAVFVKETSDGSFSLMQLPGATEGATVDAIFSKDDASYDAIKTDLPANTVDADHNYIATESGDSLAATYFQAVTIAAAQQTGTSGATFTLTNPGQIGASFNKQLMVVVWLEGNDSDCVAVSAANKTLTVGWEFSVPTTP